MTDRIKVSLIVPVYNVEKYLEQCVTSLINQTYKNIEIILVDDGSTDSSSLLCDRFAQGDTRVRVVHKQNGGLSSSREQGVSAITGQYAMFIDGDDWIDVDTIAACMDVIKKEQDTGCVMFSYAKEIGDRTIPMHVMDGDIMLSGIDAENKVYKRLFGLSDEELNHPERMENIVSCCMKLYRTDFVKQGRYYDTKLVGSCEDGLFNMYALYCCRKIAYIDKPFYHYRKRGDSLISTHRKDFIKKWSTLFTIMEQIIEEKQLDASYRKALNNRIALSITAIGLNELGNPEHGMLGHIGVIKSYLNSNRYHTAVEQMKLENMPILWIILMLCSKYKMAITVYFGISLINRLKRIC